MKAKPARNSTRKSRLGVRRCRRVAASRGGQPARSLTEGKTLNTFTTKLVGPTLGVVAAAVASGGFLAVPTARADASCTVPGSRLDLHHSSGYDASIDANGATLGPTAVIRVAPAQTSQGSVTGG